MKTGKQNIPVQRYGGESNTTFSMQLKTEEAACKLFVKAKRHLLEVNRWQEFAGITKSLFEVTDEKGNPTNSTVKKGNLIRIKIPVVPALKNADGYDWVKVEDIDEGGDKDSSYIAMRVRPAAPFSIDMNTAHFFGKSATSTFYVSRKKLKVVSAVFGRNEKPNTEVENFWDKTRNLVISLGAVLGFNKPQWKSLIKGWMQKE